jgi:hypothetical protein
MRRVTFSQLSPMSIIHELDIFCRRIINEICKKNKCAPVRELTELRKSILKLLASTDVALDIPKGTQTSISQFREFVENHGMEFPHEKF